jgi:hypothetical protein
MSSEAGRARPHEIAAAENLSYRLEFTDGGVQVAGKRIRKTID